MFEIIARDFKPIEWQEGTLVVGVPHIGAGGLLLTDYILESLAMDHVAAFDSDGFLPMAVVQNGKARFPMRVHASEENRLAVLRCEIPPPIEACRAVVRCVLEWAKRRGISRILVLDGIQSNLVTEPKEAKPLWFEASSSVAAGWARRAGLAEMKQGVLSGLTAAFALEGRLQNREVLIVLAPMDDPIDEARSVLGFARALLKLLPDVPLDVSGLEEDLVALERTVRSFQTAAEEALRRARERKPVPPPRYG